MRLENVVQNIFIFLFAYNIIKKIGKYSEKFYIGFILTMSVEKRRHTQNEFK